MEEKHVNITRTHVYEMLSSILDIDTELVKEINEHEDLGVYGMTSLSAIQLVVMLEDKYEFEFRDEDLLVDRVNTFNKLFSLLESY